MCSTADSTTPKTDMSHMKHTLLSSLAARRPASSNASAAAQSRRHNDSACIKVRICFCLMAHPPKHTHGASCVEPNVSLFSLNCSGLHVYPQHSPAWRPCFARRIRARCRSSMPFPPPARQRKVPKSETAAQVYTCECIDTWMPLDTMSRQWDGHRSNAFFVAELADRGRERNSSPRRHAMASLVTSARDTRCRNLLPSLYLVWRGCGHARAQCILLTVGSARPQRMFFTNRTQIVS